MGDTLKTSTDREFQKLRNTEQSSFDKGSDYGS